MASFLTKNSPCNSRVNPVAQGLHCLLGPFPSIPTAPWPSAAGQSVSDWLGARGELKQTRETRCPGALLQLLVRHPLSLGIAKLTDAAGDLYCQLLDAGLRIKPHREQSQETAGS